MIPAVLVRILPLAALYGGALGLAYALPSDGGSGNALGIGLLLFLVVAVVSLVWGFPDGRRHGVGRSLAIWAVVAVVMGLVVPVVTGLVSDGIDWSVVGADVVTFVPFMLVLVLGPAAVGAAVGAATGGVTPAAGRGRASSG